MDAARRRLIGTLFKFCFEGVKRIAMAWFTLIFGGAILIIGLLGQIFGIRRSAPIHSHDKSVRRLVLTIGSVVVGLWLVAFSAARLLHLQHTGHW
jgi:hypothetical protein